MGSRRKPDLRAFWSKRQHDVMFGWSGGPDGGHKSDAHFLYSVFSLPLPTWKTGTKTDGPDLLKELEARGYDLTTLRFSIRMKRKAVSP